MIRLLIVEDHYGIDADPAIGARQLPRLAPGNSLACVSRQGSETAHLPPGGHGTTATSIGPSLWAVGVWVARSTLNSKSHVVKGLRWFGRHARLALGNGPGK